MSIAEQHNLFRQLEVSQARLPAKTRQEARLELRRLLAEAITTRPDPAERESDDHDG